MMAATPRGAVRISRTEWVLDDTLSDEPQYSVTFVAERWGVRSTTLRLYEDWGLVEPSRVGRKRLYSESDVERVFRVRRLVEDLGLNLAGVAAVLHLRQQVIALQREMDALRDQFPS